MSSKERRTKKKARAQKRKAGNSASKKPRKGSEVSPRTIISVGHESEQLMRKIRDATGGREFSSQEEFQEFLNGFVGRPIDEIEGGASDVERAQDLAFEALEAFPSEEALHLAKRALKLDDGCVDAQRILAQLSGCSQDAYVADLESIVSIAEARFGTSMKEDAGSFWGLLETRPYMRTSLELAHALWEVGREAEACVRLFRMLELNPNDNQGVRGVLVGWSLATGDLEGARDVLDRYGDGKEAAIAWGRVLERWISGDRLSAAGALEVARKQNPFAEPYFNGTEDLPEEGPDSYSPGEESEGLVCAMLLGTAWYRQPEARLWLRGQARS
ncbi:MAG: tetratricopeptide repeat protein [bacterium]|nr:tetratricopeptide repeat protein [bacterium]